MQKFFLHYGLHNNVHHRSQWDPEITTHQHSRSNVLTSGNYNTKICIVPINTASESLKLQTMIHLLYYNYYYCISIKLQSLKIIYETHLLMTKMLACKISRWQWPYTPVYILLQFLFPLTVWSAELALNLHTFIHNIIFLSHSK